MELKLLHEYTTTYRVVADIRMLSVRCMLIAITMTKRKGLSKSLKAKIKTKKNKIKQKENVLKINQ